MVQEIAGWRCFCINGLDWGSPHDLLTINSSPVTGTAKTGSSLNGDEEGGQDVQEMLVSLWKGCFAKGFRHEVYSYSESIQSDSNEHRTVLSTRRGSI